MTDCLRCGNPITPGQYFLRAEYLVKDVPDLLNQPEWDGQGSWLAQSPFKVHVDCPEEL